MYSYILEEKFTYKKVYKMGKEELVKTFDKKDLIKIINEDLDDAKLSSADFTDEHTKKRAFINVLGARLAMKMLFSQKIEANNVYSLYTLHSVLEELDIADIYFNDLKIDVRLVFNKEEIFIPKSHFEYNLLPDLYFALELSKDFSNATFLGLFEPKDLNKDNSNKDFYFYEYEKLQKPDKLKKFLSDFVKTNIKDLSQGLQEDIEDLFLSLVDKEISKKDKHLLLNNLANSFELREKMVEFENFEIISKEIAKNDDILNDDVLSIIGAQQVFEDDNISPYETTFKSKVIEEVLLEDSIAPIIENEILPEIQAGEEIFNDFLDENISADENKAIQEEESEAVTIATEEEELEIINDLPEFEEDLNLEDLTEKEPDFTEELDLSTNDEKREETLDLSNIETQNHLNENLETSQEEELFELPELNIDFDDLEEGEPKSKIKEKYFGNLEVKDDKPQVENQENVLDLDSLDSNALNEEEPIYQESFDEEKSSLESFIAQNEELNQNFTKDFSQEEKNEPEFVKNEMDEKLENEVKDKTIKENSEALIAEVDELLKNADLSDNQKKYLEETLSSFEEKEENIEVHSQESSKVSYQTEVSNEPEKTFETFSDIPEIKEDNDPLQVLFKKEGISDDISSDNPNQEKPVLPSISKDKKMIIAASAASVVLVSFVIGGTLLNSNKNRIEQIPNPSPPARIATEDQIFPENISDTDQAPNEQSQILPEQHMNTSEEQIDMSGRDMGKAVSDAFVSEPINAEISKIAWEVPEEFVYNDGFRKYLQIAGKNLKLNLQNNLLLATEMAYSNKVVVNLNISPNGALQSQNIVSSSKSKQIDKIVLQSVKETLMYLKMPSSELNGSSINATLIINF